MEELRHCVKSGAAVCEKDAACLPSSELFPGFLVLSLTLINLGEKTLSLACSCTGEPQISNTVGVCGISGNCANFYACEPLCSDARVYVTILLNLFTVGRFAQVLVYNLRPYHLARLVHDHFF